jgi:hypothetical protein
VLRQQVWPAVQVPRQSGVTAQVRPSEQAPQAPPPQSTSVSVPSTTPFEQEAAAATHAPPVQSSVAQSTARAHACPAVQGEQMGPPQSASVSCPFRTPSAQLGAWGQVPGQAKAVQSAAVVQVPPAAQGRQAPPPQSASVSAPFFTPSVQVAAWQVALHTPLPQSRARPQASPSAQGRQVPPPQSTSVSAPFLAPSEQVAMGALSPPPSPHPARSRTTEAAARVGRAEIGRAMGHSGERERIV